MSVRNCSRGFLFLLLVSAATPAAAPPAREPLQEFHFGPEAGPIVVPVTVQGTSHLFLLDTGSTCTGFDVSFRPLMGKGVGEKTVTTPAGPVRVSFAMPPAATVGRLPFPIDKPVMVLDVAPLRAMSGVKVDGVLGMDFLSRYVVGMDFDRGRLTLSRSPGLPAGRPFPLNLEYGVPLVSADVGDGAPSPFLVDTGKFMFSSLDCEAYRRLEQLGKLSPAGGNTALTVGGRVSVPVGRLDRLTIGPFTQDDLYVNLTHGRSALGLGFWARYAPTFDFPAGVVYLRPSRRHAEVEHLGGSGLGLLWRKGRIVVVSVAEGSPAARADVRVGDEVLSIDGRKAGENSLPVLGRMLCGEGRAVRLAIRRGEDVRELMLWLDTAWRTAKTHR